MDVGFTAFVVLLGLGAKSVNSPIIDPVILLIRMSRSSETSSECHYAVWSDIRRLNARLYQESEFKKNDRNEPVSNKKTQTETLVSVNWLHFVPNFFGFT